MHKQVDTQPLTGCSASADSVPTDMSANDDSTSTTDFTGAVPLSQDTRALPYFDVYSKAKIDEMFALLESGGSLDQTGAFVTKADMQAAFHDVDVATIEDMSHDQQTALLKLIVQTLKGE